MESRKVGSRESEWLDDAPRTRRPLFFLPINVSNWFLFWHQGVDAPCSRFGLYPMELEDSPRGSIWSSAALDVGCKRANQT